jgi:hypothetical protein
MKDLIIHLGHMRSGSTWLENNFFINELGFKQLEEVRADMADMAYCYPLSFSPIQIREDAEPLTIHSIAEDKIPVITRADLLGNSRK